MPGKAYKEDVIENGELSLKLLQTDKVNIYYMHAPDPNSPLEETCAGVNELHKRRMIEKFGLSNYTAEQVRAVYDVCKKNGYILPTMYQGNYSVILRYILEETLLPTLRELGMSFYAYSPLAGGFLAKTKQQILEGASAGKGAGRSKSDDIVGKMYLEIFNRLAYLEALAKWSSVAEEAGCSNSDLAR